MTVPILLSIRNKATRLPGKSFVEIGGIAAVQWLLERLLTVGSSSEVVIATSMHPDDAVFERVAQELGVRCFRGSEDDKLLRYLDVMASGPVPGDRLALWDDFFVVVDGDDLLCDPRQLRRVIETMHEAREVDYCVVDQLPVGATGFGVRVSALTDVVARKQESDTEVWGAYFATGGRYVARRLEPDREQLRRPELRLTLDYAEDLEVFRRVVAATGSLPDVPLEEVVAVFDAEPALAAINRDAQSRYETNLQARQTDAHARGLDAAEALRRQLRSAADRADVDAALDRAHRALG